MTTELDGLRTQPLVGRLIAGALMVLSLCGCALLESLAEPPSPWTTVRGERRTAPPSPALQRVLVLPFVTHDAVPAQAESLRVAFASALRSACGFEVVSPDASELPRTTRDELLAGGGRDASALIRLHREWAADAILFGRIASSRAHGEPAVGLKLELVDARDGALLWDAQDVVDAREPGVRASLLEFRRREVGGDPGAASQVPYDSFTRFVACSFVRTLFAPLPGAVPTGPTGATQAVTVGSAEEVPGNGFPADRER